jgi:hypothetical protein
MTDQKLLEELLRLFYVDDDGYLQWSFSECADHPVFTNLGAVAEQELIKKVGTITNHAELGKEKRMDDEEIERMLIDIFRYWFQVDIISELINKKIDAKSIRNRQSIFDRTKDIVMQHLNAQLQTIRAEALKEAAERFRVISCPLIFNERTVKPESCDKCTRMRPLRRYCTEVAAILAGEAK